MSGDGRGLRRLHVLYQGVEAIRLLDLQVAAQALAEARGARELELMAARMESAEQRAALQTGAAEVRLLAEGAERLAGSRAARLGGVCAEREERLAAALAAHTASRIDADGIGEVLDRMRAAAALERDRRLQAAADDRFGARRAWLERADRERAALLAGRREACEAKACEAKACETETSGVKAPRREDPDRAGFDPENSWDA